MSASLHIAVTGTEIERVSADVALVGFFSDQRPLRGGAGRADWRLCGLISELLARGRVPLDPGAAALLPTGGALLSPRLLLMSFGEAAGLDRDSLRPLARRALDRAADLSARSVVIALPLGGGTEGLPLDASAVALAEAALEGVARREVPLELVLAVTPGAESVIASVLGRLRRGQNDSEFGVCIEPKPGAPPLPPQLPPSPGVGSAADSRSA